MHIFRQNQLLKLCIKRNRTVLRDWQRNNCLEPDVSSPCFCLGKWTRKHKYWNFITNQRSIFFLIRTNQESTFFDQSFETTNQNSVSVSQEPGLPLLLYQFYWPSMLPTPVSESQWYAGIRPPRRRFCPKRSLIPDFFLFKPSQH